MASYRCPVAAVETPLIASSIASSKERSNGDLDDANKRAESVATSQSRRIAESLTLPIYIAWAIRRIHASA